MSAGATPLLKNFGKEMTVSILGTVIDDIGRTVPKVAVSLLTGQLVVANAQSDENGEFGFPNQTVNVGFYAIRAAMPDYEPAEEELTLKWEMDKMSLDVVLRLKPNDKPNVQQKTFQEMIRESNIMKVAEAKEEVQEEDKAKYVRIRVLFATDRNRQPFKDPQKAIRKRLGCE
jgi:hypothetical protein